MRASSLPIGRAAPFFFHSGNSSTSSSVNGAETGGAGYQCLLPVSDTCGPSHI